MARTDQRVGKILDRIATKHYPFNKSGEYEILSSQKVNAIKDLLEDIGFDTLIDNNFGIVASNKFEKDISAEKAIRSKLQEINLLVVSHIDNIKEFNTIGVQEKSPKQLLSIKGYEEHDNTITGALDNTMTNAILLSIMQMRQVNFGDDCNDVMFFFSIGEEDADERGFDESNGVSKFMAMFHKNILENNIKVINLDVTSQEYHEYKNDTKTPLFIEYDNTLKDEKLRALEKYSPLASFMMYDELLDDIQFCDYGEDGTGDDLEDITKYDIWGVTIALNTYGEIHSKKNFTYMKHIDKYFNFLHNLILSLRDISNDIK